MPGGQAKNSVHRLLENRFSRKDREQHNLLPPLPLQYLLLLDVNSLFASNNADSCHACKESVVDDPNCGLELLAGSYWVLDGSLEFQVHNVVAVVGDRRLVAIGRVICDVSQPENRLTALKGRKLGDLPHGVLVAKRHNFNGNREARAESVTNLRLIHDHNKLLRAQLHDFLAEERAAPSLDQIQLRVNLVRPINGHIQVRVEV
mmetsp:Transcript_21442/g.34289  ORF Transcript_21442/g.34289 Transcript_21442/m.34289 type:complete len:204 (-) Transcript_21442:378-989(-)